MIAVVFDTNILVSALYNPRGNEAAVVALVGQERVRPCSSPDIMAEYRQVLLRPRFRFDATQVVAVLDLLEAASATVASSQPIQASPDPDDTKFIACAIAAQADFLVTGNRRHFPKPAYGTAVVVNARQLLDRIAAPP